jgi:hypothetical protein
MAQKGITEKWVHPRKPEPPNAPLFQKGCLKVGIYKVWAATPTVVIAAPRISFNEAINISPVLRPGVSRIIHYLFMADYW